MTYIYQFDIAAVMVEVLLIAVFTVRYNFPNTTNKVYISMLCCSCACSLFDLLSAFTLDNNSVKILPLYVNYIVSILYLLTYNGCAIHFFVYIVSVTKKGENKRLLKGIFWGAVLIDGALIVTTPFTGLVINFDNGEYNHGPLFNVLYVVAGTLLVVACVLFFRYRRRLSRFQYFEFILFEAAVVVSIAVQFVFPYLLIENFIISLFLVLVYISLQNPEFYMDAGTCCYNKEAFYETVEKLISRKTPFKLVGLTIDGLEYVNSLHGVEAGEDVVDAASVYFRGEFGKRRVFHLGDEKYVFLLDGKTNLTTDDVVDKVRERFAAPAAVEGSEILLTPRICELSYPEFDAKVGDIIDALEWEFRTLTRSRDNSVLQVTAEALSEKRRRSKLTQIIKRAIRNDEFEIYYQPIRDTSDGKFHCAEALIRLRDKELGFISPDEFIPLAEKTGTIINIGEMVFRSVCRFLSENDIEALGVKYIEVNLSTVQCIQEQLADRLTDIMREYGINPEMINFEITETADFENKDALLRNMNSLLERGGSFSMDDYGTGYSTANYLITLPLKIVKIDKSILWPAMENAQALVVLRNTVHMLKELNKVIVVEGIETAEMERILVEMGCDYLQGYLYSKPIPEGKFLEFLSANNA